MTPKVSTGSTAFWCLVEYRLRKPAIGAFTSQEEAEAFRQTMPQPKGWHPIPVEGPLLSAAQLTDRLRRAGMLSPGADNCADH